jgi:ferredoxin
MPKVRFRNKNIDCAHGSNLRQVMLDAGLHPYNGRARYFNCRGLGTCGTCAVRIEGDVSPVTKIEKWRLNFPPHTSESNLRLACQCFVIGDVEVKKQQGFWGEQA